MGWKLTGLTLGLEIEDFVSLRPHVALIKASVNAFLPSAESQGIARQEWGRGHLAPVPISPSFSSLPCLLSLAPTLSHLSVCVCGVATFFFC